MTADFLQNYIPEILIVDDIEDNIQIIARILQSKNYEITVATSGKQALDSINQDPPDVILLDISMPEMDGIEVCKEIKNNEESKDIPVIFITALSDKENVLEGFDAGAVDYITKPFNSKELIRRVDTHLSLKLSKDIISEQNTNLKKLIATKDRFFSIIAHDLKNPFNSLLGFTNLLITQYSNIDDKKRLEYAQIINDAAKNGYQLLENLLFWSRAQLEKIELKFKEFDIELVIRQEILNLNIQAISKNINIELHCDIIPIVHADKQTTEFIVRNILSNAIKYSNEQSNIEIFLKDLPYSIEVAIKDYGIGIKQEKIHSIFSLDEIVTTKGTNQETGTGLGLVLCKEFIEKNGGKISVESNVGKGSIFKFTLPKQQSDEI